MKHSRFAVIILSVLLISCAPVSTPAPINAPPTAHVTSAITATPPVAVVTAAPLRTATPTPAPTLTPPPTPTRIPQAAFKENAILYAGPGNVGYDALATVQAGTRGDALGTFGDFVKMRIGANAQTGFVSRAALDAVPNGLAEIPVGQVPWQSIPVRYSFSGVATEFDRDQITITNESDDYYNLEGTGNGIGLTGPFRLTMQLKVANADSGSLKLLGIPEPTSGTWWQGIRRMDVHVEQRTGYLGIYFRDGTSEGVLSDIQLPGSPNQMITLVFEDAQGRKFHVLDANGQEFLAVDVTTLPGLQLSDGLFPQKRLYLGATSSPRSTLTIAGLTMQVPPSGKLTVLSTQGGLKDLAAPKGITIGTAFDIWHANDTRYYDIMRNDFNVVALSEFSCQKDFWLGRGQYNFASLDRIVNFALLEGWRVRASHLIFGASEPCPPPGWFLKGNFSRDENIQILEEYVHDVVTHFKGRVTEWGIANEAISRSWCNSGCDFWNDKIGPDYIEIAFRAARQADPTGVLIFNETNDDSPRNQVTTQIVDKLYQTVKTLKAKGVPIDVVGMQMHFLNAWEEPSLPQKDAVIQTMRKFADLGVRIYVTEMDVNLTSVNGSRADKWNLEANVYRDMLRACIESGVCSSFATWGVSDSTSPMTCTWEGCGKQPEGDPLMFDNDFIPKPAYYAARDALLAK